MLMVHIYCYMKAQRRYATPKLISDPPTNWQPIDWGVYLDIVSWSEANHAWLAAQIARQSLDAVAEAWFERCIS